MTQFTHPRIGFACKWLDDPVEVKGMKVNAANRLLNGRTVNMRWLREHPQEAEQRLWDIMNYNAATAERLVRRVGSLEPRLRMVRLGSEMLPGYTEKSWTRWWQQTDIQAHLAQIWAPVGRAARELDVRLSFHPGQFCVLASENDDIVHRSIAEFEYHTDLARWMGYGKQFQDIKINVHISGRRGPEGIKAVLPRLSAEARNCITIENDEMSWGVDASLELAKHCALVLDIHHHWVRTGEYILPQDDRIKGIVESWRGVRPVCHYSVSREDILVQHDPNMRPDSTALLLAGHKKTKLRAHSDWYWNHAVNQWALSFNPVFDIMCESKGKNLASFALAQQQVLVA
jgi:UV DNA damage repair endonuclease